MRARTASGCGAELGLCLVARRAHTHVTPPKTMEKFMGSQQTDGSMDARAPMHVKLEHLKSLLEIDDGSQDSSLYDYLSRAGGDILQAMEAYTADCSSGGGCAHTTTTAESKSVKRPREHAISAEEYARLAAAGAHTIEEPVLLDPFARAAMGSDTSILQAMSDSVVQGFKNLLIQLPAQVRAALPQL